VFIKLTKNKNDFVCFARSPLFDKTANVIKQLVLQNI